MKSVSASLLAVLLLASGGVLAQQPAPEPDLPRPPMPSMEGQQGPVVSATAVSPPSKKKHEAAVVEPTKPQPVKKPAPEAKPPKGGPQKASKKAKAATKAPTKKAPTAKATFPKKGTHAGAGKAKKK